MSEKMVNEKENAVDTAVEGTTNDKEPKEEVKAGGKKAGNTAVTEKVKKESKKKEGELTAESTESEKNLDKDKKAGTEKIQDGIKIRTYPLPYRLLRRRLVLDTPTWREEEPTAAWVRSSKRESSFSGGIPAPSSEITKTISFSSRQPVRRMVPFFSSFIIMP